MSNMEELLIARIIAEAVPKIVSAVEERLAELVPREANAAPVLLSASQAAKLAGVARGTWYDLVHDGFAPRPISLSPTLKRWLRGEVEAFIEDRKTRRDAA